MLPINGSKSGLENVIDLIVYTNPAATLTSDQVVLTAPEGLVEDGEGRTLITITAIPGEGYLGERDVNYSRLDLATLLPSPITFFTTSNPAVSDVRLALSTTRNIVFFNEDDDTVPSVQITGTLPNLDGPQLTQIRLATTDTEKPDSYIFLPNTQSELMTLSRVLLGDDTRVVAGGIKKYGDIRMTPQGIVRKIAPPISN